MARTLNTTQSIKVSNDVLVCPGYVIKPHKYFLDSLIFIQ